MRRREFITLLGSTAAAWPLAVRAQRAEKIPTIGFLGANNPALQSPWTGAFLQRLRELGWIEGRNIAIEYRWAEGRDQRAADLAAELVNRKVDVILVNGTPQVLAAKQATSIIPIVFVGAGDPIGSGIVVSLARPGGNVTGVSQQQTDTATKRLELLREVVPGLRRLAVLADVSSPNAVLELSKVEGTAAALGLEIAALKVRQAADIAPALEAIKGRVDGLYVAAAPLLTTNRVRIHTLALAARLPTIHNFRELVEAGGLMSYGPNFPDLFRRAADLIDKVLRGAKPADLPVEQPTRFDLVINLTTARALGLTIPEAFLSRADEVIE